MRKLLGTLLLFSIFPILGYGQGYISYDYLSSSNLKDDNGNKYGSGNLMKISGRYTLPISSKQNDKRQITAWTATLNCTYGIFNNKGTAKTLNPNEILNSSLTISHIRPISEKWSIISSIGGGFYAVPQDITLKSILANGAIIFVYKLRHNLYVGIGAGLTNSYGVPMVLPMSYLSWQSSGKYDIRVDMSNGMRVSVSKWFGEKIKVELTAIEMDGMSAVMNIDGKSKIYSTMMMKSYLSPSFHLSKRANIYLGLGGNWLRSIKLSDRSIKGFFNSFKSDDDSPNKFGVALRLTAGFHFSF